MNRRTFLHAGALSVAAARVGVSAPALTAISAKRVRSLESKLALPSQAQLAWQRDELAMFLHFGVNTFTDREWGDGKEEPTIFDPSRLDARQWARTAKAA